VRQWCKKHHVIYQPYAGMRNYKTLSDEKKEIIKRIGDKYGRSEYATILRFFVQTGASMIPRSSNNEHLAENMKVFQWSLTHEEMREMGWVFEDEKGEL